MQNPAFLKRGEIARLIPVVADTRKEQRTVSTLLAVMAAVPALSDALLTPFGQNISQRVLVNTFTEVELVNGDGAKGDRPDGLIQVVRGKKTWHAIVEAKIGTSELDENQVERYLKLARDNSVDAVLTISNEFAPRPSHHPLVVAKNLLRRVQLFHMSWTHILTEAILLQDGARVTDPEQAFLLRELIRFLSHDSVGVSGYTSMPSCWTDVVSTFQSGGNLNKRDSALEELVAGWHQECRDLSLQLTQFIARKVDVYLTRKHEDDPIQRLNADVERLCKSSELLARLRIPDTASDIYVVADLRSRTIRVSMELEAPRDKQRTVSRVNWLLRQMKGIDPSGLVVRLKWSSRAADDDVLLSNLINEPKLAESLQSQSELRAFEIIASTASGKRFKGRRTFIEELESICPRFYEHVGQHLKPWRPSPPKPKDYASKSANDSPKEIDTNGSPRAPGNQHSALLELPKFLLRAGPAPDTTSTEDTSMHPHVSRFTPYYLRGGSLS